jgi:hypothetical protein
VGGAWATALISSSAGKVESPVVDDATGQQTNDPSTATDSLKLHELQTQVTELHNQVESLEIKLKLARKQENQKLQNNLGNSLQPDYEAARDRILNKLKVGRQSSPGKAIDAFIKELQRG